MKKIPLPPRAFDDGLDIFSQHMPGSGELLRGLAHLIQIRRS